MKYSALPLTYPPLIYSTSASLKSPTVIFKTSSFSICSTTGVTDEFVEADKSVKAYEFMEADDSVKADEFGEANEFLEFNDYSKVIIS